MKGEPLGAQEHRRYHQELPPTYPTESIQDKAIHTRPLISLSRIRDRIGLDHLDSAFNRNPMWHFDTVFDLRMRYEIQ